MYRDRWRIFNCSNSLCWSPGSVRCESLISSASLSFRPFFRSIKLRAFLNTLLIAVYLKFRWKIEMFALAPLFTAAFHTVLFRKRERMSLFMYVLLPIDYSAVCTMQTCWTVRVFIFHRIFIAGTLSDAPECLFLPLGTCPISILCVIALPIDRVWFEIESTLCFNHNENKHLC